MVPALPSENTLNIGAGFRTCCITVDQSSAINLSVNKAFTPVLELRFAQAGCNSLA